MTFNEARPYQYEIGENVFVYINDGKGYEEFEHTCIKNRRQSFGENLYHTDWGWQKERFLQKIKPL